MRDAGVTVTHAVTIITPLSGCVRPRSMAFACFVRPQVRTGCTWWQSAASCGELRQYAELLYTRGAESRDAVLQVAP